ncbi:interferon-induced protein 44-like [Salminus brasiliensis]|uniref:interferon-induced protein 44-like n=1 Tax=Salminus brasiliensis TaxID=930266 RepID=UPI003B82EBC8
MGGKKSKPEPAPGFDKPWRNVDWTKKQQLETELRAIRLNHPQLQHLRILLHGPVGAGKSCFINSVQSSLHGELKNMAYEQSYAKKSFTKIYKSYNITNRNSEALPFALNDVMGLEEMTEEGMHSDDVVKAMMGHIREGYKFNPVSPICNDDPFFIREPSLQDKVHCLVSVVPASAISRMDTGIIDKIGEVRSKASSLGIPHVVIMTKVDEVCPLVKNDLTQIYRSRKIHEKMQHCSYKVGPPLKCVFPVCNYHKEIEIDNNKDVLILMALLHIVKSARDYVATVA